MKRFWLGLLLGASIALIVWSASEDPVWTAVTGGVAAAAVWAAKFLTTSRH